MEISKIETGQERREIAEKDKLAVMVIHNKYYCTDLFFLGKPLEYVAEEMAIHIEFMVKLKQEFHLSYTKIWQQLILNLLGKSNDEISSIEGGFNKDKQAFYFSIYLAKSILFYFRCDYDLAFINVKLAEKYAEGGWENRCFFQYNFYCSLILTARYVQVDDLERKKILDLLIKNQQKMKKWTQYAPKNYLHKYELIEAEKARILGEKELANNLYDRAIKGAIKSGYIHEEGLANELAAQFYLSGDRVALAGSHFQNAYNSYLRWQSGIKVKDLQEKYPNFIKTVTDRVVFQEDKPELELSLLIQKSQFIYSEKNLEKLLYSLIKITLESNFAKKTLFFIERDNSLVLAAAGIKDEAVKIFISHQHKKIDYPDLPIAIVNDIYRTKEVLIIDGENNKDIFAKDAYIIRNKPKSIVGLPIVRYGKLKGILYLEDCSLKKSFSEEILASLKMLTSQVSIAIENSNLSRTIYYQNLHDSLTNLPNRQLFERQLSGAIAKAKKNKNSLAVLFIDLDRFKKINDNLTHKIGDRLLQNFAKRLLTCLASTNTVARWGGDEFTVLIESIKTKEETSKLAEKILNSLKQPFKLKNIDVHITSSIGIAIYPEDGENGAKLLSNADAALYNAKDLGGNTYQFYDRVNKDRSLTLLKLENFLYRALDREEFVLYYQPQINIKTGTIYGVEALIRWQHPQLGLISPDKFIPLAEETGLIIPIGEWVLKTACIQNKIWQDAGLSPLKLSVNLSPRQFQQKNLLASIEGILSQTKMQPYLLELEVTENSVIQNTELASKMLCNIREMGVSISMDDFGVGYSSLGYLKKFPFHTLKIDRFFIRDMQDTPEDTAIISAAIAIAEGFNLRIVVEGVETKEQLNLLHRLKCEYVQGYLFSKPLNTQSITDFLFEFHQDPPSCILPR